MTKKPSFVFLLLLLPLQADAQTSGRFGLESVNPAQRTVLVNNLSRGATFASDGKQYQLLPDAMAAKALDDETLTQAGNRLSVRLSDVMETKGRYLFFRASSGSPAVQLRANEPAYPVVLNSSTGELGLLPGTIAVTMKNVSLAGALATDHGLQVERTFPHLGVAFLRADGGRNVLTAAATLGGDARVTSAEPEVLEHIRVPR